MVETEAHMNAGTQGIGELIEQRRLMRVPDHQRDYAWMHDDEVEQFLEDIRRAIADDSAEYFLGLIVLVRPRDDRGWEILDGQQRLATTTMIYAAIREWLHAAGFEDDARKIQNQFIGVQTLGEPEDKPRITLNINDRQAFHELVVNRRDENTLVARRDAAGKHSSVRRLIEAALTCRKKIAEMAAVAGGLPEGQAKALYAVALYLRDRATVVAMNVASTANAYMIFESLNDRGLDLSVLDLVKNHLFGRAGSRLDEVQANWTRMTANLGDREADDFLKVFWTSKYGRIQRGRLFEEWRVKHDGLSPANIVKLSDELATAADLFAALDVADHEAWATYSNKTRAFVRALAVLGNQQVRPVMLAALRQYTPARMERLLGHLETLIVRYQTIGKGRTGLLEIAGARLARGIANGELQSPARVWHEVAALVPKDDDFRIDMTRYTETKHARARYILAELEATAYRRNEGRDRELVPATDELNLEHILPRNPGAEWQAELNGDADLRDEITKLGNMCLLQERANRALGGKGFAAKKRALYGPSDLLLTKQVADYATWTRVAIDDRQARLADLAIETWPLPKDEV